MNKVNIANYVIYDLANRIRGVEHSDMDTEIVDLVAETWHKKHFISGTHILKHQHDPRIPPKFMM